MEAVNSFVMSWWPVFAGIFAVLVLLAQLWNSALRGEQNALHERANQQDQRLEKLADQLNAFQLHASEKFVTSDEIDRLTTSVNDMKRDVVSWLERIENRLQTKADK